MTQDALMKFDPQTGDKKPYPSHVEQYRDYHGKTAWLYNPWTGAKRDPRDIGTDVEATLCIPLNPRINAEDS